MTKKKIILIDSDEANYKTNEDLLDKLDEIVMKKENKENKNTKKPC